MTFYFLSTATMISQSTGYCIQTSSISMVVLFLFNSHPTMAEKHTQDYCDANTCSVLHKAQELGRFEPSRELKKGGENEGQDYWEEHESLFQQAWSELPHLHPELYIYNDIFQERFINKKLREAVTELKLSVKNHAKVDESTVRQLVKESETVKDVFHIGQTVTDDNYYGLFTKEFCQLLLEELEYLSNSGIPMRRPNGMNRYGAILGKTFHTLYIVIYVLCSSGKLQLEHE